MVRNPKRLKSGEVYVITDSKLFTTRSKVQVIANKLSQYVTRSIMVSPLIFDPLYDDSDHLLLFGDFLTIAEIKSSTDTSAVKEAIGQVLTYSEVIKVELDLIGYPRIPIDKVIVLPREDNGINPLLEIVCEALNINIVYV